MSKTYDIPIAIQRINDSTELWEDAFFVHARINKAKSDSEYLNAGAIQGKRSLVFEVRYFTDLQDVCLNTQSYRILYGNVPYNISDYDDYMQRHKTVKFLGDSY